MINAAVLGSPINHSLSPVLHNLAYEILDLKGSYEAIEIRSGELSAFLESTSKNCLSLTMPLKEEALSLATSSSLLTQRISSGNTLTLHDGKWHLTSTDVAGFKYSLKAHGINAPKSVLVLGAGATARAAVSYLSTITQHIQVMSRSDNRRTSMNKASDIDIEYLPWEPHQIINEVDLVINTSPGEAANIFVAGVKNPRGVLFEVIYHPWPTAISQAWARSDKEVIDGLELLIHQAISQIEIFSDHSLEREYLYMQLRKAALRVLE